MNVTVPVTPSLSIAASINSICAGTPVNFTATPANGGATPVYQWTLNGQNTGTNSPSFTSSTLANGDVINCTLTSNATCAAPASATSNSITMNVTPLVTPSVSISASVNSICAGTAVAFTATPVNGGAAPIYQWLLNGQDTGTNSATFTCSALLNGDVINCTLMSTATCVTPASATSNSITMNVSTLVAPLVSIAASINNICAGTPVTFTANAANGGVAPGYQWMLNGSNAGTNSATFTSSTLLNGDVISCTLTSNATCATPATATSNSITMNVTAPVTPSVSIAAPVTTICAGTPVTFIATAANGGAAPVYQWILNGQNTGINAATFSSGTLSNGDVIGCMLTSNAACATPATATSNSITMNVTVPVTPSVSIDASTNSVCAGTPVTFTATPVNGGAAPAYQWMLNGQNAGSNNATFSSSTLSNADVITCVMTSNTTCATPASATSNTVTLIVYPLPAVNAGGNKTINQGSSTMLNATATGNIAEITWSPANGLSNYNILNPVASPAVTTTYTLMVQTTDGCVGIDEAKVIVLTEISIPNTFTPNGDGINDLWDIKNLNTYQNSLVQIFDRYGQQVYQSKGYYQPWDGTLNNKPLPVGTYYYVINLNDGHKPYAGYVAIIR